MAEKDETVNVNAPIADRNYPLKVHKGDEEQVRNAIKLVGEKLKEYQMAYAGKDKQDYMAMCLLNFAVENVKVDADKQHNDRVLEEKLNQLEAIFQI